jgi:archaellum component FlaC
MFEKDPRTFGPGYDKLSPEQKAMVKLEITLTNFFKEFNKSISRWERMVYPAIILLGILGLSGFYLIYHLTGDMHDMTDYIDPEMESNLGSMAGYMRDLSNNIQTMTVQIATLTEKITSMEAKIGHMDGTIGEMNGSISHVANTMDVMTDKVIEINDSVSGMDHSVSVLTGNVTEMNQSMKAITVNTGVMTRDMGVMNQSISRPASFLNQFAPW